MTTIREVLRKKGSQVWSVSPTATVFEALEVMAERHIGAVMVLEGQRPIGILSERDYARKIILMDRDSRDTPVKDIMTVAPVFASPGMTVDEGMEVMTRRRVRHLPVLESGSLIGMVSIGDIVQAKLHDQKHQIRQLESYITG